MASVNKVIIIGNLTKDPEVRYTGAGQAVANFSVACNESWTDKAGAKQERVEFVRVTSWGKLAELAGEYLQKGRQVYVEGRLQTREWTDKEDRKQWTTEVVASEIVFLGSKPDGAGTAERAASPAPEQRRTATGSGPTVFPNYGRSKGGAIAGATTEDLEFYASGARRSLADPAKSKWHDSERALLAAIEAEIRQQESGGYDAGGSAPTGYDDGSTARGYGAPSDEDSEIPF